MSNIPSRPSEHERAQRRRDNRDRLQQAAEQLLSPEGWMRWVLTRASLRGYSTGNCILLAQQCHERGIVVRQVCGLHGWHKLGRRVREGEQALRITAPITSKRREGNGPTSGDRRMFFRTTFVFEISQTEPLPGTEPGALELHEEPLSGCSHAHLLVPLRSFAESLDYAVCFRTIPGPSQGWCDTESRRIAVDDRLPANMQVRTLIHECAHALGVDYQRYRKDQAEVIADTVAFLACASVGLAVDTESVPYVADWARDGALEAIVEFAQTIDKLTRRIEDAVFRPERGG